MALIMAPALPSRLTLPGDHGSQGQPNHLRIEFKNLILGSTCPRASSPAKPHRCLTHRPPVSGAAPCSLSCRSRPETDPARPPRNARSAVSSSSSSLATSASVKRLRSSFPPRILDRVVTTPTHITTYDISEDPYPA